MENRTEVVAANPYMKFHRWLLVFCAAALLSGLVSSVEINIGGFGGGTIGLFLTLVLPMLFLNDLIKMRGSAYVFFFLYGLINSLLIFFYAIPSLILLPFLLEQGGIKGIVRAAMVRAPEPFLVLISFVIYSGVTLLAWFCWKKIRPEYKLRDLFSFSKKS